MDVSLKTSERLIPIDAARGLAILGIFTVNIGAFSAPYFLYGGERDAWPSMADQAVLTIIDIFFQASFYTLFSILFGFGMQLLKERLLQKEMDVNAFLFRRLFILIGFGILHAFLLWHGDILLSYGVVGLFFMAFVNRRDKTLLFWGLPLLALNVYGFSVMLYSVRGYLAGYDVGKIHLVQRHYMSDDLSVILQQNAADWFYANSLFSNFFLLLTLLPLFLFGMYLARKRWLHDVTAHKHVVIAVWATSFLVFIGLKMGPYLYGNPAWFSYIQDNIGGTASALFYLISIVLLGKTGAGEKLLRPFSYVGRMSLTNYILQSVISFILFYGVGFGLYGSVRPVVAMAMVLVLFTGQVFFSKWWMKRYRFGPLEWLWRSLTYKSKQPMRGQDR